MRLLLVPALMLPLALAACDDGSERITELEGTLNTERAKVVDLEQRVAEIDTLRTERDNLVKERDELIVARDTALGESGNFTQERETLTKERDELVAERDRMRGELETVQARVVELEEAAKTAVADAGDAFDTTTLQEPMQAILIKLRDTQEGLERLETEYSTDDKIREAVANLRTRIGETGRDIRTVVERAKIELE